jgi:LacI family transcriptional regulator
MAARPVTLKDVARAAGIHYSTASRVLNPSKRPVNTKTAERVRAVADRLGYRGHMVARSLRLGTTKTIGVVVPDLGNPAWAPVVHGIATALEKRGYEALIGETQDDHGRYGRLLERLAGWRVDAIITAATRLGDRQALELFVKDRVPVFLVVRTLPGSDLPTVSDDGVNGGAIAADHLASLGHRMVAQLCGPADVQVFIDREHGFRDGANNAGIVVRDFGPRATSATYEEGLRLMDELLRLPGPAPTGVFVHNDLMAIGAMDAVTAAGLHCPQDVSIIGYNDSPLVDRLMVSLTSVRFLATELGRLAGEMAMQVIEQPAVRVHSVSLPPILVARASTGPPPQQPSR